MALKAANKQTPMKLAIATLRKPASHPPYEQMIKDAIITLKKKTGSSQYAIAKFIEEKHKHLPSNFRKRLFYHLKKLVASQKLVKVKGSFKLPPAKSYAPKKKVATPNPKPKPKPKPQSKPKPMPKSQSKPKPKPMPKPTLKAKETKTTMPALTARPKPKATARSKGAAKSKAASTKAKPLIASKPKTVAKRKPTANAILEKRPAKAATTFRRTSPRKKALAPIFVLHNKAPAQSVKPKPKPALKAKETKITQSTLKAKPKPKAITRSKGAVKLIVVSTEVKPLVVLKPRTVAKRKPTANALPEKKPAKAARTLRRTSPRKKALAPKSVSKKDAPKKKAPEHSVKPKSVKSPAKKNAATRKKEMK